MKHGCDFFSIAGYLQTAKCKVSLARILIVSHCHMCKIFFGGFVTRKEGIRLNSKVCFILSSQNQESEISDTNFEGGVNPH